MVTTFNMNLVSTFKMEGHYFFLSNKFLQRSIWILKSEIFYRDMKVFIECLCRSDYVV